MDPKRLRLKELRIAHGLTWGAVAGHIERSYDQARRHELVKANFELDILDKYATLYGVHPAELFSDVRIVPKRLEGLVSDVEDLSDDQIKNIREFIKNFVKRPAA